MAPCSRRGVGFQLSLPVCKRVDREESEVASGKDERRTAVLLGGHTTAAPVLLAVVRRLLGLGAGKGIFIAVVTRDGTRSAFGAAVVPGGLVVNAASRLPALPLFGTAGFVIDQRRGVGGYAVSAWMEKSLVSMSAVQAGRPIRRNGETSLPQHMLAQTSGKSEQMNWMPLA